MIQIKTLLEIRKKMKEKKPDFIREDYQRRKRLGRKLKWKKPKGIHSKIRHHFKGRRKMPSPGYKSPQEVKGFHAIGLEMVRVNSVEGLKRVNNKTQGIIIFKTIGAKKRLEVLKTAMQLNIKVLNLNAEEAVKKIEDFLNSKKKKPETKKEQKEESKKAEIPKPSLHIFTEKQETKPTDEEKKEIDKKEMDRVLTKRT